MLGNALLLPAGGVGAARVDLQRLGGTEKVEDASEMLVVIG
jgi:hypothetical protein